VKGRYNDEQIHSPRHRAGLRLRQPAALPAGAQTMKPGLGAVNTVTLTATPSGAGDVGRAEALANMSPEQRQQMQNMMEQHGVQLDVGAGGALTDRMCMTQRNDPSARNSPSSRATASRSLTPAVGHPR
jgi:hypothetical protein